jgi:hypothetical protein
MIMWKAEVEEINNKASEGKVEFLKLLQEKYNSYIDFGQSDYGYSII